MEKELIRIKAFVNAVYDNEKYIKIQLSEKDEQTNTYTKSMATIWKTKLSGEETFAFKKIKEIKEYKKLGWIDVDCARDGEYKGKKQFIVRNILDYYILTDEQYNKKMDDLKKYLNSKKNHSNANSLLKTPSQVKPSKADAPWEEIEEEPQYSKKATNKGPIAETEAWNLDL